MGNLESSSEASRVTIGNDDEFWRVEQTEDNGTAVCLFTAQEQQREKCLEGLKILRVLRHPNILKFLSSPSTLVISYCTELVYPVQASLPSERLEGVVRGWRDVGCGLEFIHTKAKLSHNNLHIGCVFVGGHDSKWKIGGFELATSHIKCTPQYFVGVSAVRHRDATPPEDEEDMPTPPGDPLTTPIHSRDVWAFGNLMLQTIEEISNEETIPDEMIYYINNEMLNQSSPEGRPPITEIMRQEWLNNSTTDVIEFLTNLTLKSQTAKDDFFHSLVRRLHTLPSTTLAEHIVPLLLTPLVMAEPGASRYLWQHLLCPVSLSHPRTQYYAPELINPLLEEHQFRSHVLPLLLNLLESREYHVRLVLLHYLHLFCNLCPNDELANVVLPEVLVGLKDCHDDIVAATLHALAELVPIIGSAVVMGTNRKNVFTDSRPKIKEISDHVYTSNPGTPVYSKVLQSDSEGSSHTVTHHTDIKQYSPSASITGDTHEHKVTLVDQKGVDDNWEGFERGDEFPHDWNAAWDVEGQSDNDVTDKPLVSVASNEKSSSNNKVEGDLRRTLKGQLSEEDVQRLEEQAEWSKSVDLFVDMAPTIKKTVRHTTTSEQQSSGQLNYTPLDDEMDNDAWGDQEWHEEEF